MTGAKAGTAGGDRPLFLPALPQPLP
jgi:hypothetical protein